jgi:hypothetical protein
MRPDPHLREVRTPEIFVGEDASLRIFACGTVQIHETRKLVAGWKRWSAKGLDFALIKLNLQPC